MTNLCVSFLEPEFTYEIWQQDMCVAGSDSLDDAIHYLMMMTISDMELCFSIRERTKL